MKKVTSLLLVLVLFVMILTVGCGKKDESTSSGTEQAAEKGSLSEEEQEGVVTDFENDESQENNPPITIGWATSTKEGVIYDAFEDFMVEAAEKYTEKTGREITIEFTCADNDAAKQTADVEDLISRDMDLIIITPQDSRAIISSIKACKDAGIPVMTYNRPASPDADVQPDAHVGLETYKQGYTTAIALCQKMKDDGVEIKIINVLGALSDENAVRRSDGLKDAVAEFGGEVVQDVPTDWDPEKALSGLSSALQAHSEATGLFIASDFLIPGIKTAMERSEQWIPYGQDGHLYFGSQDVFPAGYEAIEEGIIDANTAFDIWPMSTTTIDLAVKIIDGETLENNVVEVEGRVVTPDNIDSLENIWAKWYMD